jgi:hypothetical protein
MGLLFPYSVTAFAPPQSMRSGYFLKKHSFFEERPIAAVAFSKALVGSFLFLLHFL